MNINESILVVPPDLRIRVEAAAAEEHLPVDDMLQDIIEHGLRQRQWKKIYEYGESNARKLGLTEEDVPRLIKEYRQERRRLGA
jgi:alpha-D-ribose 1-methylphosphonate 5-triphosphate diphosphatase PhnM